MLLMTLSDRPSDTHSEKWCDFLAYSFIYSFIFYLFQVFRIFWIPGSKFHHSGFSNLPILEKLYYHFQQCMIYSTSSDGFVWPLSQTWFVKGLHGFGAATQSLIWWIFLIKETVGFIMKHYRLSTQHFWEVLFIMLHIKPDHLSFFHLNFKLTSIIHDCIQALMFYSPLKQAKKRIIIISYYLKQSTAHTTNKFSHWGLK